MGIAGAVAPVAALPWQMLVVVFHPQVWEKEQDGLWGHSPFLVISIKMLRMPSVLPKKEELKKLLQAPSPPRYQTQQVIKTHPLHLKMTLHTVQPCNGLSSASGGKEDEKSAQDEKCCPFLGKGNRKSPGLGAQHRAAGTAGAVTPCFAFHTSPALSQSLKPGMEQP